MGKNKPKEPTFSRAELIAAAESFGTRPEIMAGALYGVAEATKAEAETRLKKFLIKGVTN